MSLLTMNRSVLSIILIAVLIFSRAEAEESPHGDVFKNLPVPAVVDFNRDVRPVISEKCYHCHGPDDKARKAKLRLDLRAEAVKEREGKLPIKPGDADHSDVMDRITTKETDDIMPPPKEGHAMTQRDIEIIRKWINQGAPYAEHWAFAKPKMTEDLKAKDGRPVSGSGAIDFLINKKLAENGMKMSPRADMHTLVRRTALDLTGLPPTTEEISRFTNPAFILQPSAFEQVVDHYLASPAYGERWARVWLDVARYADSAGYGSDPLRLNIWPYRDWLIKAFNSNMRYDQFTVEQLAGDLLPNPTEQQLVATAFHRNTMTNTEGGTDDEEFRVAAVKDRIAVTMQAWMGLTLGCAQCHSHKFDPMTQKEYYQFFAIFNQTADSDKANEAPTMPLPTVEQTEKINKLRSEIAELEKSMSVGASPELVKEFAEWESKRKKETKWVSLKPATMKSEKGVVLKELPDQSILAEGAESDVYTIEAETEFHGITGIRLEALTDDRLPGHGPGRSEGGNFVLSEFKVTANAAESNNVKRARYIRVAMPGKARFLHLAEVQVFSGGKNIAPKGTATQSSTAYNGPAKLANDGKTDGDYKHGSVSHTAQQDDPWWEVDLMHEVPVESIVIWNRTDGGTAERTVNFTVSALDEKRKEVFSVNETKAPKPSVALSFGGPEQVAFREASADFEQTDFKASQSIDGDDKTGWSIGPSFGQNHTAVFLPKVAIGGKTGSSRLIFTLAQHYGASHTLGRFRLSLTTDKEPQSMLPESIRALLSIPVKERSAAQTAQLLNFYKPKSKLYAETRKKIDAKKAELAAVKPLAIPVMMELAKDMQRESHFLNKGNFLDPGEVVQPALLQSFHAAPLNEPVTRLTVAKWLTSRDNPLTARVMVNRLWAQIYGVGLVETEEDFGTQGTLPSHPELLDTLAIEFMESGWDIKTLLRSIVMSQTYQQSSKVTPEALQKDSRNRLLSHYPRRRLDAEQVRDQALALSGLLSPKIGGPSVFPPQPDGLWRAAFNGQRSWETSKGEDRYRRGLYTFWRRTVPYPSMATFDAPSRENTTLRRVPTNTPLQAFVTLNDPAYVEMAQALGRRMVKNGGGDIPSRVRFGLELCLARPASAEQVTAIVQLYEQELANYSKDTEAAKKLAGVVSEGHEAAEMAAWTVVANVLLNLDGVLMKG
jgi:hypothetical protein